MTTVLIGTNRFEDCQALLSHGGQLVLGIAVAPLSVTLHTPLLPEASDAPTIHIIDNRIETGPGEALRVIATDRIVSILQDNVLLVVATLLDDAIVSVALDLRPLGLDIHTDADVLHIGPNRISGNHITNAKAAISLS